MGEPPVGTFRRGELHGDRAWAELQGVMNRITPEIWARNKPRRPGR